MQLAFTPIAKRLHGLVKYNALMLVHFILVYAHFLNLDISDVGLKILSFISAYVLTGISAYLFHDIWDRKPDLTVGKFNIAQSLGQGLSATISIACALLGALLIYNLSHKILPFILVQWVALGLYSAKPFRIKEKPWGFILDALYAHLFPTAMLFALLQTWADLPLEHGLFFALFSFNLGIRDILWHQLNDQSSDQKLGINTLAVKNPQLTQKIKLISEWLIWVSLSLQWAIVGFTKHEWVLIPLGLSSLLLFTLNQRKASFQSDSNDPFRLFFPLSCLFLICKHSSSWPLWAYVGLLHPYVFDALKIIKQYMGHLILGPLAAFVNRISYHIFLVFGRNLKDRPLYKPENEPSWVRWLKNALM